MDFPCLFQTSSKFKSQARSGSRTRTDASIHRSEVLSVYRFHHPGNARLEPLDERFLHSRRSTAALVDDRSRHPIPPRGGSAQSARWTTVRTRGIVSAIRDNWPPPIVFNARKSGGTKISLDARRETLACDLPCEKISCP